MGKIVERCAGIDVGKRFLLLLRLDRVGRGRATQSDSALRYDGPESGAVAGLVS
jgi:hypothetical protein